jgi:glycosyltransferase involved in cell wall biosynthesis
MIVFCHLLNDRSGSPVVLRATLEVLDAQADGLLYVGSQGRGVLEEANVPTHRFWYRRSRHRIVTLFTYFASQLALYQALSRARDIPHDATVFVNTLLPFGAMLWGRRTGRRVVVHVHEVSITPGPLRQFLTRCARRCAALLIYVSEDHRARLPIDGPPSRIVSNPVSPELAARARTYSPRRCEVFNVLMLASLRGYKGVEEFMALAATLRQRKDIAFILVLNAEPAESAAFAARFQEVPNVTIYPRTGDPAHFYEVADLVLNLARVDQWIETFGLTLAEAMTFGIPVIAPPIGGPAEIVTHGCEGYCIDSRDSAALRAAVLTLADDPETYATMSRAARLRSQDFTFDAYAKALRTALDYSPTKAAP